MVRRRAIILGLSALSLAGLGRTLAAQPASEAEAVKAAEAWLKLVDAGQTAQSWEEAAPLFKQAVTKEQWQQALGSVRTPLGKATSRQLLSKQTMKSLPGAPDGTYVVIQYQTSFEKKSSAVETITPMLCAGGRFRMSGYYIR
jgi:hypothetical protein